MYVVIVRYGHDIDGDQGFSNLWIFKDYKSALSACREIGFCAELYEVDKLSGCYRIGKKLTWYLLSCR